MAASPSCEIGDSDLPPPAGPISGGRFLSAITDGRGESARFAFAEMHRSGIEPATSGPKGQ